MLAIKLRPVGKKKQISFRIVIAEKKSKLKGKSIEDIGWYNPHTNLFSINNERAAYWIAAGAIPTDSVHNIFVKAKLINAPKVHKHGKGAPKEETVAPQAQQGQQESATEPVVQETPVETAPAETAAEEPAVQAEEEKKEE